MVKGELLAWPRTRMLLSSAICTPRQCSKCEARTAELPAARASLWAASPALRHLRILRLFVVSCSLAVLGRFFKKESKEFHMKNCLRESRAIDNMANLIIDLAWQALGMCMLIILLAALSWQLPEVPSWPGSPRIHATAPKSERGAAPVGARCVEQLPSARVLGTLEINSPGSVKWHFQSRPRKGQELEVRVLANMTKMSLSLLRPMALWHEDPVACLAAADSTVSAFASEYLPTCQGLRKPPHPKKGAVKPPETGSSPLGQGRKDAGT